MELDDISTDPSTYPPHTFYKTFINYFNGALDCGQDANVSTSTKGVPCYNEKFGDSKGAYLTLDGKLTVANDIFDNGQIVLQDGTLLLFENPSFTQRIWISVDINGYNTPPNRWGYDLFTFQFIDGELITMGDIRSQYNDTDKYCNRKGSGELNGIACAQLAKEDTDYFKSLVREVK